MAKELPVRPSLEHLKAQAKELLEAFSRAEPEALARVRASLPAARAAELKRIALHDAQSVVAREYGFESWAGLRREVVRRRPLSPELLRSLMQMPLPPQVEASLLAAAGAPAELPPALPEQLPLVAVRNAVILVGSIAPLCIGRARSQAALDAALAGGGLLAVFAQTRDDTEEPARADLYEVGCAAQIVAVHRESQPGVWIVLRALQPVRLVGLATRGAFATAQLTPFELDEEEAAEVPGLARSLLDKARPLAQALPDAERVLQMLEELSPLELADVVVANLPGTVQEKARYAAEPSLPRRLARALSLIDAAAGAPA